MGQLQHFDVVERLLQNQQAVRATEPFGHLIPGIIGIGGADNDLEVRVGGPKPGNGFDAVPARGHADIYKSQRVRVAVLQRAFYQGKPLLALSGGIEHESDLFGRSGGLAEKSRTRLVQCGGRDPVEDLPKVAVDGLGIINDQDAQGVGVIGGGAVGNSPAAGWRFGLRSESVHRVFVRFMRAASLAGRGVRG